MAETPTTATRRSDCCNARVVAQLTDGVLAGSCDACGRWICRRNPRTGATELLHGQPPWSDPTPSDGTGTGTGGTGR